MTNTPNLQLDLIQADRKTWADRMNANLKLIDAAVGAYFTLNNLQGLWENSHAYTVNQTVVDPDTGTVWTCQVAHTSLGIPNTFADDRAANSTYWTVYSSPARARGAWTGPGTTYAVNDFVVSGSKYAVCIVAHTSSSSFNVDEIDGKWSVLVDLSTAGSQVLPVPGGGADANKFVVTTAAGLGYTIVSAAAALGLLGATSIGTALLQAVDAAAARTAIGAQVSGSYQAANATLTALSGAPTDTFGIALLDLADAAALRSATGVTFPASMSLVGTSDSQTLTDKTINGRNNTLSNLPVPGFIYGLTLSTAGSSTTMSFAAGSAVDSTGVFVMSGSAWSKTTSAFSAGTGNGMLDAGAIANSTQYHIFLISKTDGTSDYLCSLSPSAPTMPSGYTYFRRIGSIKTNGSAQWQTFLQVGDYFYIAATTDFTAGGTSAMTLRTLSVPTGVVVRPLIAAFMAGGAAALTRMFVAPAANSALTMEAGAADGAGSSSYNVNTFTAPATNTSAQIYVSVPSFGGPGLAQIITSGWIDMRGKEYLP